MCVCVCVCIYIITRHQVVVMLIVRRLLTSSLSALVFSLTASSTSIDLIFQSSYRSANIGTSKGRSCSGKVSYF